MFNSISIASILRVFLPIIEYIVGMTYNVKKVENNIPPNIVIPTVSLLAAPGTLLPALGSLPGAPGSSQQLLAALRSFRQLLAAPDNSLQLLAIPGSYSQLLATAGSS